MARVLHGRSYNDVVAHLTAWRRRSGERLRAVAAHAPDPWPTGMDLQAPGGLTQINEWLYQQARHRPVAAILRESEAVWGEFMEAAGIRAARR